jgi:hypothetical protein
MEFTLEMEKNNSINFLDINIERYITNLGYQFKISIYKKPNGRHHSLQFMPPQRPEDKGN